MDRSVLAQQILDNPVFMEVCATLAEELVAEFLSAHPKNAEDLRFIRLKVDALQDVREELRVMVTNISQPRG